MITGPGREGETRNDNLLRWNAAFVPGADTLDADNKASVQRIGGTFREGTKRCATCGAVTGVLDGGSDAMTVRVTGQGADPQASARARDTEVQGAHRRWVQRRRSAQLRVRRGGDRVDFVVGGGVAQNVAAHEAGHMFGLGDECAVQDGSNISGTGKKAGEASKHDQLAKDMGLPGAVHENNDGMMSLGSVVRPQHYSTFFWALKEVSGMNDWALGPTQAVSEPGAAAAGEQPEQAAVA